MNLPSTFRLLALAALVTAPVLAQQTQRRVIVVPAGAAPAGAPAAPATGGTPAAPATGGLPTAQPGATTLAFNKKKKQQKNYN